MKKYVIKYSIALCLMMLTIYIPTSHAIMKTVGSQVQCDTANTGCQSFPTQMTNVCTASCTLFTTYSFTTAGRFWGNNGIGCRTSTNDGVTWANCTVVPTSSGGKEDIGSASDGSILNAARGGGALPGTASDCVIRRSTDNAASWSAGFIVTGAACGGALENGNRMVCLSTGECILAFLDVGTANGRVLRSTDNGATWTLVFSTAGAGGATITAVAYNGNVGFATGGFAGQPSMVAAGATWSLAVANFPAGTSNCLGAYIMTNAAFVACEFTSPQMRIYNTGIGIISTFTMPNSSPTFGPITYSLRTGLIYAAKSHTVTAGALPIGVWVSTNSGTTWNELGVGNTLANSMAGGSIYLSPHTGCIYVSGGTIAQFIKIC